MTFNIRTNLPRLAKTNALKKIASLSPKSAAKKPILPPIIYQNVFYGTRWGQNLASMEFEGENFEILPKIPDEVEYLSIWNCNNLTTINSFPKNAKIIRIINNPKLRNLPASLPDSVIDFVCVETAIEELPILSKNLENLGCHNNRLRSLPHLPGSLVFLDCNNNYIREFPVFSQLEICDYEYQRKLA